MIVFKKFLSFLSSSHTIKEFFLESKLNVCERLVVNGKIMFLRVCYMDGKDKCFIQACAGGFDFSFLF